MADRFPLILNTSANQIQEIASGDTLDLSGTNIKGVGIITATNLSGNIIAGAGTSNIVSGILTAVAADIDDFIDVGSNIQLGNAGVVTATTFSGSGASLTGIANANVASNAAIAGSKISPNFGTQTLTAGLGYFTNNLNTTSNFSMTGGNVQINLQRLNHTPNYRVSLTGGSNSTMEFRIRDTTNNLDRFIIKHTGVIEIPGDLDVDGHTNLDNVNIAGVTTTTDNINIDADNKKLQIGDGQDLQLYHSGSHSDIHETGSGNLRLRGSTVQILNEGATEQLANFISDGAVELYFNNEQRFATQGYGANIFGQSAAVSFNLYTAGGTKRGGLYATNSNVISLLDGQDHQILRGVKDGTAELYFDNAKKIETTSTGISVTGNATVSGNLSVSGVLTYEDVTNVDSVGIVTARAGVRLPDNQKLQIGNSQDLELFHTGTNSFIQNSVGNLLIGNNYDGDVGGDIYIQAKYGENSINCFDDGGVELFYDASKKFETTTAGGTLTGSLTITDDLFLGDTDVAYFGNSNDFMLYHSGTHSYIKNKTNNLYIMTTNSKYGALLYANGGVELRYDDVKKFETTNTGITVTGTVAATSYTGDGSQLTGVSVGITTEQVSPASNVATLDLTKDDHKIVASGTYTIDVTGGTEADSHVIRIENSGTANVGFSTYFKFPSGGTPALPTASGAISLISFSVHKVGSVGIATVLLAGASVNYS